MNFFGSENSDSLILICVFGLIFIYFFCFRKSEQYQNEINTISRENEIVKDKYPYQDVNQQSIPQQQNDYKATYAKPQELADNYAKVFPDDLLPQHKESNDWARVNPSGKGSLELKNMLSAGTHIGVNTQGSSLRNANQQLRSEAPNPIIPVSIFNNSSITPDIYRKPLEIGEDTTSKFIGGTLRT